MSPITNEITVEEEGFITTKKGLTFSSISLFIWILTSILYTAIDKLGLSIDYTAFCFFVSLALSGLSGYYITKSLVKNVDAISRLLLVVANILLLYTSANGIQSGYSFLSAPTEDIQKQNDSTVVIEREASLFPFIDAKPWLPDPFQSNRIQKLENKNELLKDKVNKLEAFTADRSELINEIEILKKENQNLKDSVENLSDYYQIKNNRDELRELNQRLNEINVDLENKFREMGADYSQLKDSYEVLNEECKDIDRLRKMNERLTELNREINDKMNKLESDYTDLKSRYSKLQKKYNALVIKCNDIDRLIEVEKKYNKLITPTVK